jgi:hypothetical protein
MKYMALLTELAHAAHSVLDRGSYDNLVRDAWIIPGKEVLLLIENLQLRLFVEPL